MKAVTSAQVRELDGKTIESLGIPGIVLMENAGYGCFMVALDLLEGDPVGARVGVLCGKGNNGGDGFVIARHLINAGADARIFLFASRQDILGDALVNLKAAISSNVALLEVTENNWGEMEAFLADCDLVVDALLGTGARGELRAPFDRAVEAINVAPCPVLAADIPTGVDADTGAVAKTAVRAAATVTFVLPKVGLLTHPGAEYCGELFVRNISIPRWLINNSKAFAELITPDLAESWLPRRKPDCHKGDCGRVLVIGGSRGMIGAPALMARGASMAGTGLIYLAVPEGIANSVAARLDGEIIRCLPQTTTGAIAEAGFDKLQDLLDACDAVAIGPGLTQDWETKEFVLKVISDCRVPLVIDADGLNAVSEDMDLVLNRSATTIITPHPGEAARLLNRDTAWIQANRFQAAGELVKAIKCVAVLKGAATLVAAGDDKPVFINSTGNPGMATGGAGDVLTGLMTGFMAQGVDPCHAAALGTYIHGLAGDMAADAMGGVSMGPGDILRFIPESINALLRGQVPMPVEII